MTAQYALVYITVLLEPFGSVWSKIQIMAVRVKNGKVRSSMAEKLRRGIH